MQEHHRAVLWDLDGTILDSREYHWLSWRDAMAAEGRALSEEEFATTFGQRNDTILRRLYGPGVPPAEIVRVGEAKEMRYRELVRARGVQLLPGVGRWLDALRAAGWRQALATSAPPANVECILEALRIGPYFDAVVHADDVTRGKPDPQVFLLAAGRVQVPASRCIVVEDAPAGIEGARRAGMHCIGVGPAYRELPATEGSAQQNVPAREPTEGSVILLPSSFFLPAGSAQPDLAVPSLEVLASDAFERIVPAHTTR